MENEYVVNHIINSFINSKKNTFQDIFLYVKRFVWIDKVILQKALRRAIKSKLVSKNDNKKYFTKSTIFTLTDEGKVVLKDNIYYNARTIQDGLF